MKERGEESRVAVEAGGGAGATAMGETCACSGAGEQDGSAYSFSVE
jgi:hypothetical protein